jgi:hypothetical protein
MRYETLLDYGSAAQFGRLGAQGRGGLRVGHHEAAETSGEVGSF